MLSVETEGPVHRITLNRPEVRNAFNSELIESVYCAFDEVPASVRVIVLQGAGEVFCAGGDLNWMRAAAGFSEEENHRDAKRLADLLDKIATCPAAVIARVHGPAFGGGCGLVAAADIALASETARFAFSEVRLGLIPATISPHVVRKIGEGQARALFVTGEVFDAQRALQIGLVQYAGSLPDLEHELNRKIDYVLASGPRAVAEVKAMILRPPTDSEETARLLARIRSQDEARDGIAAFLEKRKPPYWVDRS